MPNMKKVRAYLLRRARIWSGRERRLHSKKSVTSNRPTLSLPFYTMTDGADLTAKGVTFTRAGLATQYDSTGKLTYAPNNLMPSNANYDLAVAGGDGFTGSLTTEQADAFGGTTGVRIQINAAGWGGLAQRWVSDQKTGTFIWSFWAKSNTGADQTISMGDDNGVGGQQYRTIRSNWTRVWVKDTVLAGAILKFQIYIATGSLDITVCGLQLEQVTYQTEPGPFRGSPVGDYYGPRLDYDPVTLAAKGLLIEESRTNQVTYSGSTGAWYVGDGTGTFVDVPGAAVNGSLNACRFTAQASGSSFRQWNGQSSVAVAVSFFIQKKVGSAFILIGSTGGTGGTPTDQAMDLATGTGVAGVNVRDCGDCWRLDSVVVPSGSQTIFARVTVSNGASVDFTGLQVEAGSFATSYIPTTSASVTRAAEQCYAANAAFGSLAGTLVVTYERGQVAPAALAQSTAFNANGLGINNNPGATPRTDFFFWNNPVFNDTPWTPSDGAAENSIWKSALSFDAGAGLASSAVNGTLFIADGVKPIPSGLAVLNIGRSIYSDGAHNGHIRSISYYNTRKTNAELQALTTAVPATTGIVISGDSLMAGATTTNGPMSSLYASYTTQSATSRAISGETLATMDVNYATDYAPYYNASTANTLVSEGGINDILAGATLAQLQTRVQSIAGKARTTGFVVCVSTIARASTSGPYGYTAGMETIRQNYNTWMRANYTSFADRLLDLDNIPALADPTNTAYFNSDMLHWTNLSNSFVADVIRTTLGVAARPDTVPEAFTFSDLTGATPSTAYTSNTITVIGINGSAAVSITGGTYSKNGGAFTSSAGTAVNGDTFVVKRTSSASNSSAVDVTLTIGGVSDTYTITTAAGGAASLWSASDASAMNFTLTSGGLVAQKNTPASYNPLRSNSSKATGKLYIEFKATGAGTNAYQIFGFCNAGFVLTAGTYLGTGSSGASIGIFGSGAGVQGGFTSASVARIKNANATIGDINMFAVDLDSGFGWVGFDGTWGASGNPVTGANPAFYWTPASVGALYAAMSAYDGSEGAWKICADAASQTYAPPTGFSAWG